MKKQILTLFAASALLFAQNAKAQMEAGCIAADFTATDLNGTSWHLYDILDAGKTVYIDVSATWCGPCWNYHNGGALENLYNTYGPLGTDEVMVFFIEGDHATTNADLNGTGSNTLGNWVVNTPYPIIDDNATLNLNNLYEIAYFPTIYMICPDRIIREVGQMTTPQLYAQRGICTFANTVINGGTSTEGCLNNTNLASCTSVDMSYRLINHGSDPMTSATVDLVVNGVVQQSFNWTGSLDTYLHTILTFTGVTGVIGSNNAEFNVTNVNGMADADITNNSSLAFIVYPPIGGPLVSEQYTLAAFPPPNWTIVNGGAQNYSWVRATAGSGSAFLEWYEIPAGDQDFFQLPSIDMTGYVTATLTFDVAHAVYSAQYTDNLKVKASVDCGATWVQKYNKSGSALATAPATTASFVPTASQWRNEVVDLTQFAGNANTFIRFEGTSGFGNNVYLDNINTTLNTGVGNMNETVQFSIFPNPASDKTILQLSLKKAGQVTVEISTIEGQILQSQVQNMVSGNSTLQLNTKNIAAGVYFVAVKTVEGKILKQLVIQ